MLLTLIAGQLDQCQGHDVKDRYYKEYGPAADRVEHLYTHMQLTETQVGDALRSTPGGKRVFHYALNGDAFRVEGLRSDAKEIAWASINTSTWRFSVQRNDDSSTFFLTKAGDETYEGKLDRMRTAGVRLPFAAYCILNARIRDYLGNSDITIKSAEEVKSQGETLVRLHYERFTPSKMHVPAWFLFAPEDSWVVREYQYGGAHDRCVIQYGEKVDGIPIIQKAEYWREGDGGRHLPGSILTAEASDVKLEPGKESEFRPTAFGISEASLAGGRRFPWMLTLGMVGLACALVAAYVARRRRAVSG